MRRANLQFRAGLDRQRFGAVARHRERRGVVLANLLIALVLDRAEWERAKDLHTRRRKAKRETVRESITVSDGLSDLEGQRVAVPEGHSSFALPSRVVKGRGDVLTQPTRLQLLSVVAVSGPDLVCAFRVPGSVEVRRGTFSVASVVVALRSDR